MRAGTRRVRPTRSLRFRLTAIATAVVAVVLAATAFAVLEVQRRQLVANLDHALEQRADALAQDLTHRIPGEALRTNDEDRAVQLVGGDGRILASSANLTGAPALADPAGGDGTRQVVETRTDLPLEDDSYRVLTRSVDTVAGPAVLHVAENSDDLEETLTTLRATLALVIPAVIGLLAALMWWLTGRALTPVGAIRAEVDAINSTDSGRRVPVPHRDDEIGRLARTMNHMLDRLAQASERQQRFVADAAHELRTPLTRIRTTVEVDLAHPPPAGASTTNELIRSETIALQALIDDLLHLARGDAGRRDRSGRPVDLDDIVMGEIRLQRALAAAGDTVIDAGGVSAAHLSGDPDDLARAVRNVLDNAMRHARSSVGVTLHERHGVIELTISDDGPGVPDGMHERIFERFGRVDDARTRGDGGSGLGLAIARDIVRAHRGTIVSDPSSPTGARFVITLPAAPHEPAGDEHDG